LSFPLGGISRRSGEVVGGGRIWSGVRIRVMFVLRWGFCYLMLMMLLQVGVGVIALCGGSVKDGEKKC